MHRIIPLLMGTMLLLGCATSGQRQMLQVDKERFPLEGTWECAIEPENRQIKILNQTHFIWVAYDRETGLPLRLAGGTYHFDGKTYTESILFGSAGLPQELVGKDQVFTAETDGYRWYHSGVLSNGMQIVELWKRVTP
jgi:hypothetical protein